MTQHIPLNAIKQGIWIDALLPVLKQKISKQFQLSTTSSSIKVTHHLTQRMALIYGLSQKQERRKSDIEQVQLKHTTYFATLFHKDDFYPLLTGLLKLHYHTLSIDWNNALEVSKILNYEMERGSRILLETDIFL